MTVFTTRKSKIYYNPPDVYDSCEDCRFHFGCACHFCSHPKMKDVAPISDKHAQGLLLCTDECGGYGSSKMWKKFGFPDWCPLDDYHTSEYKKNQRT
ncbi:MAG: hypothetical protein AMQ22_00569 [Candidatus Methanofastidiosum methylothiophilum]|uniref:Uncharacterized protein n=1 Tax=Candidatus Methanofastidiosum methylothiophilum TaxID=1705564 RepID=A0A150J6R4_9EURY|nr:MAG: hypothetical protein AMQ22_00569 [Candidatus Methanofastidiosum methylthiophilus]